MKQIGCVDGIGVFDTRIPGSDSLIENGFIVYNFDIVLYEAGKAVDEIRNWKFYGHNPVEVVRSFVLLTIGSIQEVCDALPSD